MTWDGMLPEGVKCKRCGAKLRGTKEGYPAERYLGTFNGLCYSCTDAKPYFVKECPSGAHVYSHPPMCPSWRRTRERYHWFPDCLNPRCKHGKVVVSRSDAFGGSYGTQCKDCETCRGSSSYIKVLRERQSRHSVFAEYWRARVEKEAIKRLGEALQPFDKDSDLTVTQKEIVAQTRSEGPQYPYQDCPIFPEKWAKLNKTECKKLRQKLGYHLTEELEKELNLVQ